MWSRRTKLTIKSKWFVAGTYLAGFGEFCVECGADSVLSDLGLAAAASVWVVTSISAVNGNWLGGLRNLKREQIISAGSDHTGELLKISVSFSTKLKQNILTQSSVFVLFSPVHTDAFSYENGDFLLRFRLLSTLKQPKTLMEAKAYDSFFVTDFKRLRFHLSTLRIETDHFQNDAFLKPFTQVRNRFCKPPFSTAFSSMGVFAGKISNVNTSMFC